MTFNYSICHPERENIEHRNNSISGNKVLEIAKNYPWVKQLDRLGALPPTQVYYNPSLDFSCIENGKNFCLTAHSDDNENLTFSLWYNRPQKVKILFGLLGEKERMTVDYIEYITLENAIKYLGEFVHGNYTLIEELYKSKR